LIQSLTAVYWCIFLFAILVGQLWHGHWVTDCEVGMHWHAAEKDQEHAPQDQKDIFWQHTSKSSEH
jgi:hypothetical protein